MSRVVTITDFDYFRAVEHLIIEAMQEFEAGLLDIAVTAVSDAGLEIRDDFPVEGYYYLTPVLTKYFHCLKTLQNSHSKVISPSIQKLHDIYTDKVFGSLQAKRTAINSKLADVYFKEEEPVTISRMMNPISVALKETENWSIEGLMNHAVARDSGCGLVGFANLVDHHIKLENKLSVFNPVATCMACETTVLSSESISDPLGDFDPPPPPQVAWKVSQKIVDAGRNVLRGHRNLIQKHSATPKCPLEEITKDNILGILGETTDDLMALRCICLGNIGLGGSPRLYYHWMLNRVPQIDADDIYQGFIVSESWSSELITTEKYLMSKKFGFQVYK